VKGAALVWVCGAAVLASARRQTARGGGLQVSGEVGVCALARAARALLRQLSERLIRVGAGWARLLLRSPIDGSHMLRERRVFVED
jgi:hypothetical protein